MVARPKSLGILSSAALSAGLVAGAAQAQTAFDYKLPAESSKSGPPPVAIQLYPLPKLDLSRRDFSQAAKPLDKPQLQLILPEKNYYNQDHEKGVELWDGATANMKGPLKVRLTIHFR